MLKGMRFHAFRYTKYYHRMAGAELALDLLNDAGAQAALQVRSSPQLSPNEPQPLNLSLRG